MRPRASRRITLVATRSDDHSRLAAGFFAAVVFVARFAIAVSLGLVGPIPNTRPMLWVPSHTTLAVTGLKNLATPETLSSTTRLRSRAQGREAPPPTAESPARSARRSKLRLTALPLFATGLPAATPCQQGPSTWPPLELTFKDNGHAQE